MFTWGRGNYGQLGRTEPTNHSAVLQSDDSPVVEDVKEVSFPGKVDALYGAEQVYVTLLSVIYILIIIRIKVLDREVLM